MCENWKIEHWEEKYEYTHIWVAQHQFGKRTVTDWHQVVQVAMLAEVESVLVGAVGVNLVEVYLTGCASSASADSVLPHIGKAGSRLFNFHEP